MTRFRQTWAELGTHDRIFTVLVCVLSGAAFAVSFGAFEPMSVAGEIACGVFFGTGMLVFAVPRIRDAGQSND